MFTGIIEEFGVVKKITKQENNLIIKIEASFLNELKINQSIAHNGICLSVTKLNKHDYTVCAVNETIKKTNLRFLKKGDLINLERSLMIGSRLDGHFVQGHIDEISQCEKIVDDKGSWIFRFKLKNKCEKYIIPQGSIALNGVSLTISNINFDKKYFEISVIPYTFMHTNFKFLKKGDYVNIEFDIMIKQISQFQRKK